MPATTNVQVVINGKDNASHVIKGVGKSFNNLGREVTSGLKTIGVLGLVGGAALTAFGIKAGFSAARVEELGFALNAIAKANKISQKEVDKTVDALRGFNIAHDKALEITSLFIQSQLDLSDATKLATVAKDLAVLASVDSSEATKTLTRAIVTQRPILLKQFGIQTGLVEIYDTYAKKINKTAAELTQAEKKQAFLNTILKEGKKVAGTYEAAMGSVSKRFRSLTGRIIPDFMAKIGRAFKPALTVVVDNVADSIENLSDVVGDNQEKIAEWGKIAGIAAEKVVEAFGEFVNLLINNKEIIVGVLAAFVAGITHIGIAFVASKAVILGIFAAFIVVAVLLRKVWEATGLSVDDLRNAFTTFWAIVKPIFEDMKKSLISVWKSFKLAFGDLTKEDTAILFKMLIYLIGGFVIGLLLGLASTLKLVATGFRVAAWLIKIFTTQVKQVIGFISKLIKVSRPDINLLKLLSRLVNFIKAVAKGFGKAGNEIKLFVDQVKFAINFMKRLIDLAKNIPGGVVGSAIKKVLPKFQTGGIVSGPVGTPQPILAHGGEEIKPLGPSGGLAGGGLTLNVNIGTFIGSEHDKRNLAEELMKHLSNIAAMQGKKLSIIE